MVISLKTYICLESTIETLKKRVNYVQIYKKDTKTTVLARFSSVSIVDFEQVNLCWDKRYFEYY